MNEDDDSELCLVLTAAVKLGESNLEVVDVYKLKDGSRIVHTVETAYATLEELMLEEEDVLVSSHGDARGVLTFPDALLDDVRACKDYEAAIDCVGRRGHWLVPASKR